MYLKFWPIHPTKIGVKRGLSAQNLKRYHIKKRLENDKINGLYIHQTKFFKIFFSIVFSHESENFSGVHSHPLKFILAPFDGIQRISC